jgi:hypothetical protein
MNRGRRWRRMREETATGLRENHKKDYFASIFKGIFFTSSISLIAIARVPFRSTTGPVTRTYLPSNGINRWRRSWSGIDSEIGVYEVPSGVRTISGDPNLAQSCARFKIEYCCRRLVCFEWYRRYYGPDPQWLTVAVCHRYPLTTDQLAGRKPELHNRSDLQN